jgi:cellulose biosynthesis protein BcsQ
MLYCLHWRWGGGVAFLLELWDNLVVKAAAAVLAPVLFGAAYYLFRRVYLAFTALKHAEAALKAVARQDDGGKLTEGPGFWLKRPIVRPANYNDLQGNSIPIMMIAATKGGVGKTSLAGSLAAYFAMRWTQRRQDPGRDLPVRVLVIDQDFQGSFSTMTVEALRRYVQPSKANRLVSGELDGGGIKREAEAISQSGMETPLSISTIPAYYDLAQAENRMLVEWLLPVTEQGLANRLLQMLRIRPPVQQPQDRDIRYLLASTLLDPHVQSGFDLVIIDAPPRLTTSHIQALCSATHLLLPTILDGLSGDAVARYLDQVAAHKLGPPGDARRAVAPHVQAIGVVCTMIPPGGANLEGRLNVLKQRVAQARLNPDIVPEECFIRQRGPYRDHAGERIAYAALSKNQDHETLRAEVDRLGDWVAPRIGATSKGWTRRVSV